MSLVGVVKRANAKGLPEESVALRVAVLVSVLAASSATLSQGVGGWPLRLASTLGIAGGFAYSHQARHKEGYALKAFLAVGVIAAFLHFLSATSGVGPAAINELQLPLAALTLCATVATARSACCWMSVMAMPGVPGRTAARRTGGEETESMSLSG